MDMEKTIKTINKFFVFKRLFLQPFFNLDNSPASLDSLPD